MIVKNESRVIRRCLLSVRKLIDGWVIVDTGSTDGTQEIIRKTLSDLPGVLHERPWVNFEHNRNEALQLAKMRGDYLLFMDADDYLEIADNFRLLDLDQDGYLIPQKTKEALSRSFQYLLLVKSRLPWKWEGLLHEELICPSATSFQVLGSITHICTLDGARSRDPEKLLKDLQQLKEAHRLDPKNPRYIQFLGITHEAVRQYEPALRYFEMRAAMGGWEEEVFYALYRIAELERILGRKPEQFLKSYGKAHQKRPSRAEPLYWIARYAISEENFSLGYLAAKEAISLPFPETDSISVERWIYEYGALLQFVKCSYQMQRYGECFDALKRLREAPNLPSQDRQAVEEVFPLVKYHLIRSSGQKSASDP